MPLLFFFFVFFVPAFAQTGNEVTEQEQYPRYWCPKEFFRAGNTCYHLSKTKTTWKKAVFKCKDTKNSTLAILDKRLKDHFLRKYLNRHKLDKKGRWIGGMYNWANSSWIWGETGIPFKYQAFSRQKKKTAAWTCTVMDPANYYRWAKRSCLGEYYFICEKPMQLRYGKQRKILPGKKHLTPKRKPRVRNKMMHQLKSYHRNN